MKALSVCITSISQDAFKKQACHIRCTGKLKGIEYGYSIQDHETELSAVCRSW